jgi:hypothetical protein
MQQTCPPFRASALAVIVLLGLAGCGGGGSDEMLATETPEVDELAVDSERQTAQAVTSSQAAAAQATANSTTNACAAIRPFYWEVGDRNARTAGGAVILGRARAVYGPTTVVPLASASKWLYGAYVVQKKAGLLDNNDIKMLTMRSGYTSFDECQPADTVQACLNRGSNGAYTAAYDNSFFYDGGHMQKHASLNGLADSNVSALAAAVRGQLGKEIFVSYTRAQPAGGAAASPDAYAKFLRKLMRGELRLGNMLGSHPTCTSPSECAPGEAAFSPVAMVGNLHYSLGHWIENGPGGDGAFSSSGALGFYPWIDASRTSYGIVSRYQANGGPASRACGQLIRKAWATGRTQ